MHSRTAIILQIPDRKMPINCTNSKKIKNSLKNNSQSLVFVERNRRISNVLHAKLLNGNFSLSLHRSYSHGIMVTSSPIRFVTMR